MTTIVDGTTGVTFPAGGVGNPASAVVGLTDTQTLTNKTLTTPVISSLSSASATALTLQSAGTTAVTIDTSQNVGIGTTSPVSKLNVNGGSVTLAETNTGAYNIDFQSRTASTNARIQYDQVSNTTGQLLFYTNGGSLTERMRIDSSGNLLVAKTSSSTTTAGAEIRAADGSFYSTNSATTNTTSTYNAYSTGASAYRFYVGMAGTVYATNTTITAISDQRLKENIRDLDDGLEKLLALKPRKFDWKEGKGADTKDVRGFIAQEFETVFPDMIDAWKDSAPEGEEPYKAINANLIPTLVKAIQELKTIVDAQATEIAELKAKA